MAKLNWPTEAEVSSFLGAWGVASLPTGVNLQNEIDAAVGVLEKMSGYSPFLAGQLAQVWEVDGGSRRVDLGHPCVQVTQVKVGGVLVPVSDWFLGPGLDSPFRWVEFKSVVPNGRRSVEISARRGYGDVIPDDVWSAVRDFAAGLVLVIAESIGGIDSREVEEVRQDAVSVRYTTDRDKVAPSRLLRDRALTVFDNYRLLGLGRS
ncbi:hypothetical protein QPK87_04795 [Kamptonema cortianum]|nr:hypothetical protein [Geitlerinema splendidum]MDK3155894.1 hypothetical protein [Kamptonema cortianum]